MFGKFLVRDVEGGEAEPTSYLSGGCLSVRSLGSGKRPCRGCDYHVRAGGPLVCLFFGAAYCAKSQQLMPVHVPTHVAIAHT